MPAIQKFGKAEWTEKKLNIFISYLDAYLIALKKQPFKKIYIDAFAGTGEIEVRDGDQILEGSAKRALEAEEKFDQYFFIEKDEQKALKLQAMVDAKFPQLKSRVTVCCGDANNELAQIIRDVDWRNTRALLFLDPYGTQVNWTTLELVSKTQAIDVWYLFPFSALNRMLPKNSKYETWERCIDDLLGDGGWRSEFYKDDPQMQLFDEPSDGNRKIKDASMEHVKDWHCDLRQYSRMYLSTRGFLRTARTRRCSCSALPFLTIAQERRVSLSE